VVGWPALALWRTGYAPTFAARRAVAPAAAAFVVLAFVSHARADEPSATACD